MVLRRDLVTRDNGQDRLGQVRVLTLAGIVGLATFSAVAMAKIAHLLPPFCPDNEPDIARTSRTKQDAAFSLCPDIPGQTLGMSRGVRVERMSGLASTIVSSQWQPQHGPPRVDTHNSDNATLLCLGQGADKGLLQLCLSLGRIFLVLGIRCVEPVADKPLLDGTHWQGASFRLEHFTFGAQCGL